MKLSGTAWELALDVPPSRTAPRPAPPPPHRPILQGRFVLKGGTALNLFLLRLPRLSVDIDINSVGTADRDGMTADRPVVEQAVEGICRREGFQPRRTPDAHGAAPLPPVPPARNRHDFL